MPNVTNRPGATPTRTSTDTDTSASPDAQPDAADAAPADGGVKRVAPQRDEILLDKDKGGGVAGAIRRVGTWYEFGIGGDSDAVDGIPRLQGKHVTDKLEQHLKPGDVIVNGNNGGLSHVAVYIGNGEIIHSMATDDTMRGRVGRTLDAVFTPLRLIGRELAGTKPKVGVIRESFADFLDRYERDTYVVMRSDKMDGPKAQAGIKHIEGLVGKDYDFDFVPANDTFYCSEIAGEFLRTSLGAEAPRVGARAVDVAFLKREAVVDPLDFFESPDLKPAIANDAALKKYASELTGTQILKSSADDDDGT
jgi:hypothetical protein